MYITTRMRHPLWDQRDRYAAGVIREYSEYTGEIGPSPNYLSDEWFTLTEDNGNVRILSKDNVICSRRAIRSNISNSINHSVRIFRGNKSYVVSLNTNGSLSCNCTGYSYRRTCSHIKEVEDA